MLQYARVISVMHREGRRAEYLFDEDVMCSGLETESRGLDETYAGHLNCYQHTTAVNTTNISDNHSHSASST